MSKEKVEQLASVLIEELGLKDDAWKAYSVKVALINAYSAGNLDGIDMMAAKMLAHMGKAPVMS